MIRYFVGFSYINVPLDLELPGLLQLQLEVLLQMELLRYHFTLNMKMTVVQRALGYQAGHLLFFKSIPS